MANKLIVEVIGDTRSYEKAMGRSSKATKTFATNVGTLSSKTKVGFGTLLKGAAVFTGLTVGVRGLSNAFVGSVRASTDFQKSMTKMIGLSGVASSAIGGLTKDVLKLAPAVGKSPQELAEALFFITSSGIPAAKALDVLTVSAKASAAGLGETQVVADAVTSALNAYGQANISAQTATDVLVATVREGKGEASEFAGVIGNVTAIAGELGASFDQVGAALAAETRLGTDAQTAATQLQQLFSALLNTSPKVAKAFDSVGLSLADTRKEIAQPNGFLPALRKIKDAFGTNVVALREAFPEIRAFRGVLALVGKQAAPVQGIFDRLAKSTGSLESAFGAISKTQAQQFARLSASIDVFRITLGSALAPAILDVVKPLNKWLSVSKNQQLVQRKIRETVKSVVGVIRDFVAVLKPLVTTAINAVDALGGVRNVMRFLIPLFIATKVVSFANSITLLGTQAAATTGRVAALRLAMLNLGAIGVVTLSILFLTNYETLSGQFTKLLEKAHLLSKTPTAPPPGALVKLLGLLKTAEQNFGRTSLRAKQLRKQLQDLTGDAQDKLRRLRGQLRGATLEFGADSEQAKKVRVQIQLLTDELDKIDGRTVTFKIVPVIADSPLGPFLPSHARDPSQEGHIFSPTPSAVGGGGGGDTKLTAKQRAAIKKRAAAAAKAAADSFSKAVALLNIQADVATRTKSLQDDLIIQKQIEKVIRARLAVTKDDVDLQQQLVDIQNQQLETQKQITENRRAARDAKIFKQLGLTAEGEKITPSVGALLHRAKGLQATLKGTIFDTPKTKKQLSTIVSVLKAHLKGASKAVRQAILQMLNDISNAGDKADKKGPLTKTHGLRTAQIIKNLGLTADQADEIQRRLAHATTTQAHRRTTTAPGGSRTPGQRDRSQEGHFVANVNVYIDGKKVANSVTRQQQKDRRRNPKQKRGTHRN